MKNVFLTFLTTILLITSACGQNKTPNQTKTTKKMKFAVEKTPEEWKKTLSAEEYRVLREKGTERAFTGILNTNKETGVYNCAGCDNPLFKSDTKFDSGTGWPSFFDALPNGVALIEDATHGMVRTEVVCAKCGGHLGHVFDDGPKPTNMRYCMNSISLDFKPKK